MVAKFPQGGTPHRGVSRYISLPSSDTQAVRPFGWREEEVRGHWRDAGKVALVVVGTMAAGTGWIFRDDILPGISYAIRYLHLNVAPTEMSEPSEPKAPPVKLNFDTLHS